MTFLSPSVLFALAAVSLPIIIHLLSIQRTREVEFSSIRFIKALEHESIRKLKLKHWLIILLRMLIIAALVMMFARPVQKGFISGARSGEQETQLVIIVDNSASMNLQSGDHSLLEKSLQSIPAIVSAYPTLTQVDIWSLIPRKKVYSGSVTDQNLQRRLSQILPTSRKDNLWTMADSILSETAADVPNKECFILSDFQSYPPREIMASVTDSLDTPWRFYFVTQPPVQHNLSLRRGSVTSKVRLPNQIMKVETEAVNDGRLDLPSLPIELYLNEQRVGQVVANINSGQTKDFIFEAFPGKSGTIYGRLVIPDDDFDLDNQYTFETVIPEQIACTVIGSSQDETFLIETALNAIDKQSGFIFLETRVSGIIDQLFLDETDVLILINPGRITDQAMLQIQNFLKRGGGVIWFMGDNYDTQPDSPVYSSLHLPEVKDFIIMSGDNFIPVQYHEPVHPLVGELALRKIKSELPDVFRYLKVSTKENEFQPILELANQDPFLGEIRFGNGRLFVFTSLMDLKWNDLAMRGFTVPLLHRMLTLLATNESNNASVYVHEKKWIRLDRDLIHSQWTVITPSGKKILYIPDFTTEMLPVTDTDELGSYRVLSDGLPYAAFSTILSPAEYPSNRVTEDQLRQVFSSDDYVQIIAPESSLSATLKDIRLGKSLWRYFLIAAILLFILETYLGRKSPEGLIAKK
ncbi:MAG: BatA domain-containing protein [Fidelibacterota bacterium]